MLQGASFFFKFFDGVSLLVGFMVGQPTPLTFPLIIRLYYTPCFRGGGVR